MPPIFASLIRSIDSFFSWWGGELAALVPRRIIGALLGRRLVVSAGADGSRLYLERGSKRSELTRADDALGRELELDTHLAGLGRRKRRGPIVLRLPYTAGFHRTLQVPASAIGDARRIAALDLERATPFRRQDVLAAYDVLPGETSTGKLRLRQIVFKRETVREAEALLTRHGLVADRIECWDEAGQAPLAMDFLQWNGGDEAPHRTVWHRALVLAAVGLAGIAAATAVARHENAEAAVRTEVEALRKKVAAANAARSLRETNTRLTTTVVEWSRAHPSRALLLDSLTRLLPDSDYLTGFQVEGRDIEVSGYSESTAALVPLIERSGVFTGATLAAPAVIDTRTAKERFTLRARIGGEGASKLIRPGGQGG